MTTPIVRFITLIYKPMTAIVGVWLKFKGTILITNTG